MIHKPVLIKAFTQVILNKYKGEVQYSYLCPIMKMERTVAFHTLGCKLNFSETSTISRLMENEGFEKIGFEENADVYVINTCSVTDNADKECRQLVRRIQRRSPNSWW